MSDFTLGLDIGQSQDHTALTAVEDAGGDPATFHLRHVERFDLGTPYPEVADEVARLTRSDALTSSELRVNGGARTVVDIPPTLVVDATGVGRPVVQMLEERGLEPYSIWITGGLRESGRPGVPRPQA